MSWAIGIDFGTSRSAGALGLLPADTADAGPAIFSAMNVSPLEIEGNRWISSAVLSTPERELVVGSAADNLAGVHPERLERTPKRALGSGAPILLGGDPLDPRDVAAAVIRMIVAEGRLRSGGTAPASCVLTHPVRWADVRRQALLEAGTRAGLTDVVLVEEPVAAAIHYAAEHVPIGAHVGVYDLGGGTFDTAVLQRTEHGFEVVGSPGGDEQIGGENFDDRLFRYFGSCLAETSPELWEQMLTSDDRKWKRAALDLLVQARRAKEALSSYTSTQVFIPIADRDVLVNRSQFEAMILDDVERTVDLMEDTVADAGLTIDDLHAVFLVGGSSRIPLVATLVTERFGSRVVTRDEPKAVVALGAARLAASRLRTAPAADSWLDRLPPPRVESAPPVAPAAVAIVDLAAMPPPVVTAPLPPPAPAAPAPVSVAWRLVLGQAPGQLSADLDDVVFGSPDGIVRCVDPRRGGFRWQVALGAPVWAAPALVDRQVVAGSFDGRVFALDRATGAVGWTMASGGPIAAAPAVAGATIVVGNDAGHLLGLDRATGAVRWDLPVGSAVRAGLAVSGRTIVVATSAGQVYAVDAETGTCHWGYRIAGAVLDTPAVIGDRVIVPGRDGIVYGLRLNDGAALYGIRCTGGVVTGIAGADAQFGVVDESGTLRVHRSDTGQSLATIGLEARAAAGLVLVPREAPRLAIVETGGGDLVAVDPGTGTVRFSVPTGHGNRVAPVMSGGLVVAATAFGQLYGIVVPNG